MLWQEPGSACSHLNSCYLLTCTSRSLHHRVPGLFAFLRRRYPVIVRHVDARSGVLGRGSGAADVSGGVDHLYIDFNHIAHSCTHAHVSKEVTSVSLSDTFAGMAAYLEALLDVAQPRWVLECNACAM